MFVDETELHVIAGNGGNGCISFRREKYVPRGGPDGGDGGDGGSILLTATPQLTTLLKVSRQKTIRADHGRNGMGSRCTGKSGSDIRIEVPLGTKVFRLPDGELLGDLTSAGATLLVARGGLGGRGNVHFATATRQVPRIAEEGTDGEELRLRLELMLLADVGLVGLPNAGKSTLLSRISSARPKIADYPFTTLSPVLGIVAVDEWQSFAVADLPGLIEGAHTGAGLGHAFLKHVERTRLLCHMVDVSAGQQPCAAFDAIRQEVSAYSAVLAERPYIVCATKLDLPGAEEGRAELEAHLGHPIEAISMWDQRQVNRLVGSMWTRLGELQPDP